MRAERGDTIMPKKPTIADGAPKQSVNPVGGMTGLLASGLGRDASRPPSTLIGREAPKFSLPPVQGRSLGLAAI